MTDRSIAIVYTIDDNPSCLCQAEDSIRSVRAFDRNIDIYVLSNSKLHGFDSTFNVRILDVSSIADRYSLSHTGVMWRDKESSPMMLMRMAIPLVKELRGYDKILYLDSDTEICNSDFKTVAYLDDRHEITAVIDSTSNKAKILNRLKSIYNSIKCRGYSHYYRDTATVLHDGYVNSGVLSFNMQMFADFGKYSNRLENTVNILTASKPKYPDQDIINVLYDIYVCRDRKYNLFMSSAGTCSVAHYIGSVRRKSPLYPPESGVRSQLLSRYSESDRPRDLGVFSGKADSSIVVSGGDVSSEYSTYLDMSLGLHSPDRISPSTTEAVEYSIDKSFNRTLILNTCFGVPSRIISSEDVKDLPDDFDIAIFSSETAAVHYGWSLEPANNYQSIINHTGTMILSRRFMRQYSRKMAGMPVDEYFMTHSRLCREKVR